MVFWFWVQENIFDSGWHEKIMSLEKAYVNCARDPVSVIFSLKSDKSNFINHNYCIILHNNNGRSNG